MDFKTRRDRCAQQLAEKRKKLEELRRRKQERAKRLEGINFPAIPRPDDDVESLVSGLLGQPDLAQEDPSEEKPAVDDNIPDEAATPPAPRETLKARYESFVISQVHTFSLAPRTIEKYEKSIQTDVADQEGEKADEHQDAEETTPDTPQQPRSPAAPPASVRWARTGPRPFRRRGSSGFTASDLVAPTLEPPPPPPRSMSPDSAGRIFGSASFRDFLDRSSKLVERSLCQQQKYDVMKDYTAMEEGNEEGAVEALSVLCRFNGEDTAHRTVTSLQWSPVHKELLLASYSGRTSRESSMAVGGRMDGLLAVWSVHLLSRPEFIFRTQSPVLSCMWHPSSPTLLVSGTYSGQILLWDTRSKAVPIQRTPLTAVGHTHPVFCMSIVGSTAHTQSLLSISSDGRLCSWNLRQLKEPQQSLNLVHDDNEVAVTAMALPPGEEEGTNIIVGAENGCLYNVQMIGSKAGIQSSHRIHNAPITSLDFHPSSAEMERKDGRSHSSQLDSLLLSSSMDWTVKLWNGPARSQALYSFEQSSDYVYDAKWSPSHPGMFSCVNGSGDVQLWNLAHSHEVPLLNVSSGERAVNTCQWSGDGRNLGVGNADGDIKVYDVPSELATSSSADSAVLQEKFTFL